MVGLTLNNELNLPQGQVDAHAVLDDVAFDTQAIQNMQTTSSSSVHMGQKKTAGRSTDVMHSVLGEPIIEAPKESFNQGRQKSVLLIIASLLSKFAASLVDDRLERVDLIKDFSILARKLSYKQADLSTESAEKVANRKKNGLWGKIFAGVTLVASLALLATGVGAGLGVGLGLSLLIGVVFSLDTLFFKNKATNAVIDTLIAKPAAALEKQLKKINGLSDEVAQFLSLAIVLVAYVVSAVVVTKLSGNLSGLTSLSKKSADKASHHASKAVTLSDDALHLTGAAKAAKTAQAAQELNHAQKAADLTVEYARAASKVADAAQKNASIASRAAQGAVPGSRLQKIADKAQKVADETANTARHIYDQAEDAQKIVSQARRGAGSHSGIQTPREIADFDAARHQALSSQEPQALFPNVPTSTRDYKKLQAVFNTVNNLTEFSSTIYSVTIQIINAEIDYLVSLNEADQKKIKAIMKLINEIISSLNEAGESDQVHHEYIIDQFYTLLTVTIPKVQIYFSH